MNRTVASLNLDVQVDQPQEPFLLKAEDDQGTIPLQLHPLEVNYWTRQQGVYDAELHNALQMKTPGVRRIRLYCSATSMAGVRLLVHGGKHRYLGRRQEPLIETLTWNRTQTRFLRFFYGQPGITILEQTAFVDNAGQETSAPHYLPAQGRFHHTQEVTGAMVVEYRPGFSLYEITYDTGEEQVSEQVFRAMKLAWLAGNIRDASIPLVRVIAITAHDATQLVFSRRFWPEHSFAQHGFQYEPEEPEMVSVEGGFYVQDHAFQDPCWSRCRQKIQPDASILTWEERQAILDCVARERQPRYHYIENTRTVKTERIYSQDNPSVYVDVERPVELMFQLRRADQSTCPDRLPSNCCPELVLRFKSN